jgi:hypothetical protein
MIAQCPSSFVVTVPVKNRRRFSEARGLSTQPYSCWGVKQFGFHVDFAELRDTATQLQECLDAFEYPHMGKSNLFNELQLRMFRQDWDTFGHFEHSADYIVRRVAQIPVVGEQ